MSEATEPEVNMADLLRRAKAMLEGYIAATGSELPPPSDEEIEQQIRAALRK